VEAVSALQRQSGLRRPVLHRSQRPGSVFRASAQHHEVVRIAHHLEPAAGHHVVERIEVDVAQQRTDRRALRRALLRRPFTGAFQDPLAEERPDQRKHAAIRHLASDQRQQAILRDRVEACPWACPEGGS